MTQNKINIDDIIDRLYDIDLGKSSKEMDKEALEAFLDFQEFPENYIWTVKYGLIHKDTYSKLEE